MLRRRIPRAPAQIRRWRRSILASWLISKLVEDSGWVPCAKSQSIGAATTDRRAAPRRAQNVSGEIEFFFPSMRKLLAKASDAQSLDGPRLTGSLLIPKRRI